jgi:hypothetical protein
MLIQQLRSAVKNNPNLFSEAVLIMQYGINESIQDYKNQAMNMEKLALAYGVASTMKHTAKTKEWVDSLINSVEKDAIFFQS